MKTLLDITIVTLTLWIGLVKLLHPFSSDDASVVEGEPAMVITETMDEKDVKGEEAIKALGDYTSELQKQSQQIVDVSSKLTEQIKNNEELKKKADELDARYQKLAEKPKDPLPAPAKPDTVLRHWMTSIDAATVESKKLNVPIYVALSTPGCINCVPIDSGIYESPNVSPVLRKDYIPVWYYADSEEKRDKVAEFTRNGKPIREYPTGLVIQPNGDYRAFVPRYDSAKTNEENCSAFLEALKKASKGK